jgi:hypothetical protein
MYFLFKYSNIGRALKSVTLGQSSLDCKANVEQFNHQCFERSVKIYEPRDIEVKKPRICGRHNKSILLSVAFNRHFNGF